MAIYIIADLHLSFGCEKPMDVFGGNWVGYTDKIESNWRNKILEDDSVIIPGDISWAMYLNESIKDFEFINSLPGTKYILKGNHDYWWETKSKLDAFFKEKGFGTINVLYNNSYIIDDYAICGTRGWKEPEGDSTSEEDLKIYNREVIRLKLALDSIKDDNKERIVVLHYPPFNSKNETGKIAELMKEYNVKKCYYGHIHGEKCKYIFEGEKDGIEYKLVSGDHLGFDPIII